MPFLEIIKHHFSPPIKISISIPYRTGCAFFSPHWIRICTVFFLFLNFITECSLVFLFRVQSAMSLFMRSIRQFRIFFCFFFGVPFLVSSFLESIAEFYFENKLRIVKKKLITGNLSRTWTDMNIVKCFYLKKCFENKSFTNLLANQNRKKCVQSKLELRSKNVVTFGFQWDWLS